MMHSIFLPFRFRFCNSSCVASMAKSTWLRSLKWRNSKDKKRQKQLINAAGVGVLPMVREFIVNGVDIEATDKYQRSPLSLAAKV